MKDGKAWVGDEVFDEDAERTGIVHDVKSGVFLLRPPHGGDQWTSSNRDRLTVTTSREQRVKR
ncbi:hypothetical protein ABZ307_28505 [Streptomyces griseorubiginosus]|uniref:hypothetical protein n=1 Tax=Streptomyces griseorubiginosus TaxID=67304 RepID=UPI0033B66EC4